jgi:BMFP domain-containing protein YqiC
MQTQTKIIEDIARLAGSITNIAAGSKQEVEDIIKIRLQRILNEMDLVPREEFDTYKQMLIAYRQENDDLRARLAKLEKNKE